MTEDLRDVKEDLARVADVDGDVLCRAALREIEELEAKLAEAEARYEVLETLIMDVAADLHDGVPAHRIDQRIGDVMRQLNEEEEED